MASIASVGIPGQRSEAMIDTFALLASGKRAGAIDEASLQTVLGDTFRTQFICTTAEAEFWVTKWRGDRTTRVPWDFGSWIDALAHAELDLQELNISAGAGDLVFEQLSCPSGGIEALEHLVTMFGGNVVSNSAL